MRRIGQALGAQHVILDGFPGIELHHRNVFVGGCVEHDLWPVPAKRRRQPSPIRDISNAGRDLHVAVTLLKFLVNVEQAVLGVIQQDKAVRLTARSAGRVRIRYCRRHP